MTAISILTAALETCEANEPIFRAAGNVEEADFRVKQAADIRAALAALAAHPAPDVVWCGCGDQIMPNDDANCGTCAMLLRDRAAHPVMPIRQIGPEGNLEEYVPRQEPVAFSCHAEARGSPACRQWCGNSDRCVAAAHPVSAPVALREVGLSRDTTGMCIVTVNGREAIRDNGDVISHFATPDWFAAHPVSADERAAIAAAECDRICAAIKAADDEAAGVDYMLDSDDCIDVARGAWISADPAAGAAK